MIDLVWEKAWLVLGKVSIVSIPGVLGSGLNNRLVNWATVLSMSACISCRLILNVFLTFPEYLFGTVELP